MQSLLKKRWDCIIIRLNVLRESHYDANSLIRLRMWCLFDNRVTTTLLLDPVFEIQGNAFSRIKDDPDKPVVLQVPVPPGGSAYTDFSKAPRMTSLPTQGQLRLTHSREAQGNAFVFLYHRLSRIGLLISLESLTLLGQPALCTRNSFIYDLDVEWFNTKMKNFSKQYHPFLCLTKRKQPPP